MTYADGIRYQILIEDNSSGTYIGWAEENIGTAEEKWKLIVVEESGCMTRVLFADGVKTFSRIWDDRASYTYNTSGV